MKQVLSENLTLFFDRIFPYASKESSPKKHTAAIGIGGNIGNVKKRFKKLFFYLKKDKRVDVVETSPILKNPPFGYFEQDYFYNAAIVIKTNMTPFLLLKFLLRTEKIFKRKRLFKNAPRSLDLDIIFFDKITIKKKDLQIPHPRWRDRESVVIPLSYIKGNHMNRLCFNKNFLTKSAKRGKVKGCLK